MENLTIGQVFAGITFLLGVIGVLWKGYKLARSVEKKIDKFEENLNSNTLHTLRLVIINKDMPLSERLIAGKEYVERGGNGEVHALYDALQEKYKEEIKEG